MAATDWKTLQQVSLLSPGSAGGTVMQLSGKLLSDAVKLTGFDPFVRSALSEIASELSVQWIALVQRVPGPGWTTIAEHGQQALSVRPVSLWEDALDREAAGVTKSEQGRVLAAFPLTAGTPFAHLLVTSWRHADEDLAESGLLMARTLSMALTLVDHELRNRKQVERLRSTLDIASRLSMAEDAAPLLELIAHEATRLLNCDRSSIFLWDKDRNEVEARPALGVKGASLRLPAGGGILQPPRFSQAGAPAAIRAMTSVPSAPPRSAIGDS